MICPKCGFKVKKARLDVYWCENCNKAILIKFLSTYKTIEEVRR